MSKFTKKKMLLALLTMTSASALAIGAAACSNGNGGNGHVFTDGNWGSDEESHWHKCIDPECTATQGKEEHKWSDTAVTTVQPTCHSYGEQTVTCIECGYVKTERIAMIQHSWSKTWTTDEKQHYYACTADGCEATKDVDDHDWDEGVVTINASCTEDGAMSVTCKDCGYSATITVDALGHSHGDDKEVTKEATCTETGEASSHCEVCGELFTEVIPAAGHTTGEDTTVTTAATCTTDGLETSTCSVCNEVFTTVIPATGHNWSEWVLENENASCNEDNKKTRHCLNDGCNEVEEVVVPAPGHRYGDWVVNEEVTCTTDGSRTHTCTVCGDVKTEIVPATGHSYTQWFITEYPTTEKAGKAIKYCAGNSAHNVEVELPKLSATQAGYDYNEETGLYNCTVAHAMGEIKFKTYNIKTLSDAVQVAKETQLQVITSTAQRKNIMVTENGAQASNRTITYELGSNYAHIYDGSEKINYYYTLNEDDTIFAVMKRWVGELVEFELVEKDVNATKESLNGYGYGFTFMTYGNTYNGLGTFINYLYTVGQINANKDFTSDIKTVDGKKVYSFSYGYHYAANNYFDVITVEFSFDDNFIVSDATLNVKSYAIKEAAADPRISLEDPHLTTEEDEDGQIFYYYDGKLLITGADQTIGEDGTVTHTYSYPVAQDGYIEASAYIDEDGTPRMRVAYTSTFEKLANGTYRLIENMEDNWSNSETYIISQTSKLAEGESLPTNPYKLEDFLISSYDIVKGEEVLEEDQTLEIDANESLVLTILRDNVLPTTYNPYFDEFEVYLVDEDGNRIEGSETISLTDGEIGYFFYSGFNGDGKQEGEKEDDYQITIKSLLAGEWTLFIKTAKTEFRLHLVVNSIAPNPLYTEIHEYNDLTEKESWNREVTTKNAYVGQKVTFRGVVGHPAYEDGNYTVSVSKDGNNVTNSCITKTALDGVPIYEFCAQEVGTYTVTLNPAKGSAVSFTVKTKEAPDVANMLTGDFENETKGYSVALYPVDDGALSGTAIIVKGEGDEQETTTITYSYDAETRTFTSEYVSGASGAYQSGVDLPYNYNFEISDAYKLYLTYESEFSGERVRVIIGGFENSLVCEDSVILAKDVYSAKKLLVNISGIYKITATTSNAFITVNGSAYAVDDNGDDIKQLSRLGNFTLYAGDFIQIWTIVGTGKYTIELIEEFPTVYVTGVELESETTTIRVGDKLTLNPVFAPENTTQRSLVWTTSNGAVATVDDNGVLTAVGKGKVTVTATTRNGKYSTQMEITVLRADELVVGENVLKFEGYSPNVNLVFSGEEGKTYVVKATTTGMWGDMVSNGITYNFPAQFEISGSEVSITLNQKSYGYVTVNVTIEEKVADAPNFDAVEEGNNTVTISNPNYTYLTVVGDPYTIYEVSAGNYDSFFEVKDGVANTNKSSKTMKYTTDEKGYADICFFPNDGPKDYTIKVVKIGEAARPNFDTLEVGETTVNVYPNYIYYTIVGIPNAKYTVTVGPDATLYKIKNGTYDYENTASKTMDYTTDENGFADICFYPGQGPGDYTITVEKYMPKPTRTVTATAPTYGSWSQEEVTIGDLDENGITLQIEGTSANQTLVITCYDADLGNDLENVDIYADGQDTNYTVTISCTGSDNVTVIIASSGGTLHNVVVKIMDW